MIRNVVLEQECTIAHCTTWVLRVETDRRNADCDCDVNGLNKETNRQTQEAHYSQGIIGSDALSHCLFITQCMLMSPLVIAGNIVNTHTVIHKHKMFPAKLLSPGPDAEPGRGKSPDTRDTRAATHKTRVPMCWHLTRVVQCSDRIRMKYLLLIVSLTQAQAQFSVRKFQ